MTLYATGADFGGELCKALGLEPGTVRRVQIDVEAAEIASVEVTYFATDEQGEEITDLVMRYALVPHPDNAATVVRPELEERPEIEAAVDEP